MDAAEATVLDLIFGSWRTQILYAGVQLGVFEAHCGPRGTSHHRQPVIKTYSNVFKICRNGACGIPRPRFCGAGGKTSFASSYAGLSNGVSSSSRK